MTDEIAEEIRNKTSSSGVALLSLPQQVCMNNMQIMRSMMALNPFLAPFVRKQ